MSRFNKYEDLARESRQLRKSKEKEYKRLERLIKMCSGKKQFNTPKEAFQKGQVFYKCPYCRKYHRSGCAAKLAANLKKLKIKII